MWGKVLCRARCGERSCVGPGPRGERSCVGPGEGKGLV